MAGLLLPNICPVIIINTSKLQTIVPLVFLRFLYDFYNPLEVFLRLPYNFNNPLEAFFPLLIQILIINNHLSLRFDYKL